MRTLAIMNLKGGVGKTTTATSMAYLLSKKYRVLLMDNDKQGNSSKLYQCYEKEGRQTIGRLLTEQNPDIRGLIRKTVYDGLDVIPSNMNLLNDCVRLTLDNTKPQQLCYKRALERVSGEYDFCIIDNPPDINIAVINALVAANDIIIPTVNDDYSHEGLDILVGQLEIVKKNFNQNLRFLGCLITQFKKDDVNSKGMIQLKEMGLPILDIKIPRTDRKVSDCTFEKVPLPLYSPRSGAARAYKVLTNEYLNRYCKMPNLGRR